METDVGYVFLCEGLVAEVEVLSSTAEGVKEEASPSCRDVPRDIFVLSRGIVCQGAPFLPNSPHFHA